MFGWFNPDRRARLAIRMRRELLTGREPGEIVKRVLVVGAGNAGALIIREMLREQPVTYRPVAVVDDDPNKIFSRLHGVPVAGKVEQLAQVSRKYAADEILVAIPSASKSRLREIVNQAKKTGLPVRILPGILAMANGMRSTLTRQGRVRSKIVRAKTGPSRSGGDGRYPQGERILVTAPAVRLGRLMPKSRFFPGILLLLGRARTPSMKSTRNLNFSHPGVRKKAPIADVRTDKMERYLRNPADGFFHAAAHKHVPLMEDAPDDAVKNNIFVQKPGGTGRQVRGKKICSCLYD